MRTDAYRIWDKEERKMIDGMPLTMLSGYLWAAHEKGKDLNDFIYMRYTGLLDKDGNPIFEGDIVHSEWSDDKGPILYGEYDEEGARDIVNHRIGFYWRSHSGENDLGFGKDVQGNTDKYKVVGNIYEKPI